MQLIDAVFILAAFFLAYLLTFYIRRNLGIEIWVTFNEFLKIYLWLGVLTVPIWIITMSYYGVYRDFRTKSFPEIAWSIFVTACITVLLMGSVTFIIKMEYASRAYVAFFIITGIVLLGMEKFALSRILHFLLRGGYSLYNVLIVGTGSRAQEFIRIVQDHSDWGLEIVGLIDDDPKMLGKTVMGYDVIGRISDIPRVIREHVIDRVNFVIPRLWLNRIEDAIYYCEREGITTAVSVDLYKPKLAKLRQSDFAGIPLIVYQTSVASEWQLFFKRIFDIAISLIGLLVLGPLLVFVSILIASTSKGSVLFRQVRSGLNGRKFTLYKFRSMFIGSEMKLKELKRQNEMDGPVFKMKRDPRVTPLGRLMRKLSIDELPQLFNVLRGHMSLVGPRPPIPAEVEMYESWQRRRLSMKPGLTCIWQVSGRNNIDFETWMEMDLQYIDNFSLWLDFKILVRTFFVVLTGYGAQ